MLSLVSFLRRKITSLHARSNELRFKRDSYSDIVHSIQFFAGIVVLHINRKLCDSSDRLNNNRIPGYARDYRNAGEGTILKVLQFLMEYISIYYASSDRQSRHPKLFKILNIKTFRRASRIVIIPLRFVLYFLIKFYNLIQFSKIVH